MPTPDTTGQGYSLATFGDPPQVPTDLANLYYFLLQRGIPRFASTAQRDSAYASPTDGQFCYVGGTDKGLYVANSGWKLLMRPQLLPDPVTTYVAATQNITSTTSVALPTPVAASLVIPFPMWVDVELTGVFGTGTTAAATIYGAQLHLNGSGAGITVAPETNVHCLSGLASPINGPGTMKRTFKATAAGTLNIAVFGNLVSAAATSVPVRGVELTIKPTRWA